MTTHYRYPWMVATWKRRLYMLAILPLIPVWLLWFAAVSVWEELPDLIDEYRSCW